MTKYALQVQRDGQWETLENGLFATETEADAAGYDLRTDNDPCGYAGARMRVVGPVGQVVTTWGDDYEPGDRVVSTIDGDTGVVHRVDGLRVTVGWDQGVTTTVDADELELRP